LTVVNNGENGKAGTGNIDKLKSGIINMIFSMEQGIPPVAGVDYKAGSPNPTRDGGDGMADHYINITSFRISMQKQQNYMGLGSTFNITSGFFNFANCYAPNGATGLKADNFMMYNPFTNLVTKSSLGWTLTNLRVKK
jgi:hypothetical protein